MSAPDFLIRTGGTYGREPHAATGRHPVDCAARRKWRPATNYAAQIIAAMVQEYRARNPFTRLELAWFRSPIREGVRE